MKKDFLLAAVVFSTFNGLVAAEQRVREEYAIRTALAAQVASRLSIEQVDRITANLGEHDPAVQRLRKATSLLDAAVQGSAELRSKPLNSQELAQHQRRLAYQRISGRLQRKLDRRQAEQRVNAAVVGAVAEEQEDEHEALCAALAEEATIAPTLEEVFAEEARKKAKRERQKANRAAAKAALVAGKDTK